MSLCIYHVDFPSVLCKYFGRAPNFWKVVNSVYVKNSSIQAVWLGSTLFINESAISGCIFFAVGVRKPHCSKFWGTWITTVVDTISNTFYFCLNLKFEFEEEKKSLFVFFCFFCGGGGGET